MADESKLLSEAELLEREEWVKRKLAYERDNREYLLQVFADLHRYREWCKRLVDCYCHGNGDVFELAEEVRESLTISQSGTSAPPTAP